MPIGMHFDSKDSFTRSTNIKKNKEQGWLTDSITIHNFKNEGFRTTLPEKEPQYYKDDPHHHGTAVVKYQRPDQSGCNAQHNDTQD